MRIEFTNLLTYMGRVGTQAGACDEHCDSSSREVSLGLYLMAYLILAQYWPMLLCK